MPRWSCLSIALLPLVTLALAKEPEFIPPPSKPLTPKEERATFQLPKGFTIDLVANEPNVVDPVAMAFDEHGRLYVAELRVYPNGGVAKDAKLSSAYSIVSWGVNNEILGSHPIHIGWNRAVLCLKLFAGQWRGARHGRQRLWPA